MYGRNINFTLLAPSLWAVVQAIGSNVEEEKYKKAINFYKKAEKLKPSNPILINNIAKTFMCLHDVGEAEKYCRRAISIDKKNDEFS